MKTTMFSQSEEGQNYGDAPQKRRRVEQSPPNMIRATHLPGNPLFQQPVGHEGYETNVMYNYDSQMVDDTMERSAFQEDEG